VQIPQYFGAIPLMASLRHDGAFTADWSIAGAYIHCPEINSVSTN